MFYMLYMVEKAAVPSAFSLTFSRKQRRTQ